MKVKLLNVPFEGRTLKVSLIKYPRLSKSSPKSINSEIGIFKQNWRKLKLAIILEITIL